MDFVLGEPGTQEIPANPVPRTSTERRELLDPPQPAKSISLSKCPVFPTSVISVNFFMWSKVMTPAEETKKTVNKIKIKQRTRSSSLGQRRCKRYMNVTRNFCMAQAGPL